MEKTKICIKCEEEFPHTSKYFYLRKGRHRPGTICRKCISKKTKEWCLANSEKRKAYMKEWLQSETKKTYFKRKIRNNEERYKDWIKRTKQERLNNIESRKEKEVKRAKKDRDELSDNYIRTVLIYNNGLTKYKNLVTDGMIEAKRQQLILKREIKDIENLKSKEKCKIQN